MDDMVNMGDCEVHGWTEFRPDHERQGGKRNTCKKCGIKGSTDRREQVDVVRYCTIKMPDGEIEDWVRNKKPNATSYLDKGGLIVDDWFQDRPGDKWPERKELMTGVLAKSNGEPTLNTCGECNNTQPIAAFTVDNNRENGLRKFCRTCDQGPDKPRNFRRRYCTIRMPDGTIQDWLVHQQCGSGGYIAKGGVVIDQWQQEIRPGEKWPKRQEFITGDHVKMNGKQIEVSTRPPHKYVDADSIPEEEANTRTTLWFPEVAAENNLPDIGGTHDRPVGAIGLADYGRIVEGLPDELIDDHPRYLYLLFLDPIFDPFTLKPGGSAVKPDDNLISRYRWRLRPDHPLRYSLDYEYVYYLEKMGAQAEAYLHEVMRAHGQRIKSSEWVRFQNTAAGVTLFTATMKELGATLIYNRKDPTYVPY